MTLGENIARLRARRGWSQEELAAALEVSRQSVSKWETDASVPDLDKLVKLSEVFAVTLDALVRGAPDAGEAAAPAPAPMPAPVSAAPAPARKNDVSHGQKIAALVLFLSGLLVFLLLLLLEGSAAGVILAVPFWLCAAICAFCRKNAGLWCAWALYFCAALFLRLATGISWKLLSLARLPELGWTNVRMVVAWGELAAILALLAATVLRFFRLPLAAGRRFPVALAAGWLGFLLAGAGGELLFFALFSLIRPWGAAQLLYFLFDFARLAALAVLLCWSARFLYSRARGG
ncbi:MAG TPA: helix-turn-helix domain-containing protein [Candidatus Fournierella merdigallinarum]|nr:helix-turn-helix domain-containing protein [Candidatus Fournierella merdigallinarum]